jgi:hypothetical protein
MPEKTVKRRLQDRDAALASDDGPIFFRRRRAGRSAQALHSRRNTERGANKDRVGAVDALRHCVRGQTYSFASLARKRIALWGRDLL